ncbi:MAG: DNA double-strand break repair nuclease NurA [Chloroflexi bacterium]|nr:DNA double-strand break repair nuclease NurA [Chloroflexota bacterium]
MPLDFQQLSQQIHQMGEQAVEREERIRRHREQALEILQETQHQTERLREQVRQAAAMNPFLRCAIPGDENLLTRHTVSTRSAPATVLAADGSQIIPDRHAPVLFGVVNIGSLAMHVGSGETPQQAVETRLLGYDVVYTPEGVIGEDVVQLMRDSRERTYLADLAEREPAPVFTLTDGPLEPFVRDIHSRPDLKRLFDDYLQALRRMCASHICAAGYVDKPGSDLLVRLLELSLLGAGELKEAGKLRPLQGVSDAALLRDLLQPGERSAIFGIQSPSAGLFPGRLGLRFFYMNVGQTGRPWLARVEIPAWVEENPEMVDQLQAVLVEQAQIMGSQPYPYILHRAHEIAVVTYEERRQVEELLAGELIRRGLPAGEVSRKQFAKDITGKRTRYS